MTDVLSNLLEMLRVRGTAYIGKNLNPPWGMYVTEQQNLCRFHLVLAGWTWIELPGKNRREKLNPGDFVIVPHGSAHILSDEGGGGELTSHVIPHPDIGPEFHTMD